MHERNLLRNEMTIDAVFRWDSPKKMHEPVTGYKTSCWLENNKSRHDLFVDCILKPEVNSQKLKNLPQNSKVFCKVNAISAMYESVYSKTGVDSSIERTIPRLFVSSINKIYVIDFDLKQNRLILKTDGLVSHLCYIALTEELFWVKNHREIISYRQEAESKLFSTNETIISMTVDWIERILYVSQTEPEGSSIIGFNLNTEKLSSVHKSLNINMQQI